MARILQDIGFVHLHVHSSYSLLEGALKIAQLQKLAAADKQPAIALTDTNNLFGALEFSEKMAGSGIQPIAGVQLSVCFEEPDPVARVVPQPSNIVLLAQNEEGYRNLMRLVTVRPVGADGFENVLVAGATLAGAEPWKEKSGDGLSVSTGHMAAELVLAESGATQEAIA